MKYLGCLAVLLAACGAAEADESLWSDNPIGGGNAFAGAVSPSATASPGSTVPAPTGTTTIGTPLPTTTAPPTAMPTGTVVPVPTGTVTPIPTGTVPPTPTGTVPPTPTEPVPVAGPVGPCAFQLDFTTASYGGRYRPRHVEAVWIETAAGQFVQTLEAYGTIRIGNLVTWNRLSLRNTVDAVTGATISAHRAHTVTWDCMDLTNNPIPEGTYRVGLELTEDDSASFFGPPTHQVYVDFVRSAQPVDFFAPDTQSFLGVHLVVR